MNIIKIEKKCHLQVYKRNEIVVKKASGKYIYDEEGKKYLDFFTGVSVCNFEHCHPRIVSAIKGQLNDYMHVSNLYYAPVQVNLADKLISRSFKGKVFFSNSGAEANECAIKIARKLDSDKARNKKRYEIITFNNSFHGRTLATLTATGQEKFKKGFEPLPVGFKHADYNDINSVKKVVSEKTVAIIVEPVQGEGGVVPAKKEFLVQLRKLCTQKKLVLIFDEIQTGMGRCGEIFAWKVYGVRPDIFTLAKSLGGGLPLGATIVAAQYDGVLGFGDHGSTFGGNPVSCAAANAAIDLLDEELLKNVKEVGRYFMQELLKLKSKHKVIKDVRGLGLMVGVELTEKGAAIVKKCQDNGLLLNCTKDYVLRFLPPLTITKKDVDTTIKILDKVLKSVENIRFRPLKQSGRRLPS